MSLTGSMYTASNGMTAHTDAMNVVTDNIANVNTTGFKESRARFSDVIGSVPGGVSSLAEAGQGSTLSGVDANFSQGSLLTTGQATHLALNGTGFFIVRGNHAGIDGSYYTRDGSFSLSDTGTLETQDKQVLQGYLANGEGILSAGVTDLKLPLQELSAPAETENIVVAGNLNAADNALNLQTFNPASPALSSDSYNVVTVYDSLGGPHGLGIYYNRDGGGGSPPANTANTYQFNIMPSNAAEITGTPTTPLATGYMYFNDDGQLLQVDTTTVPTPWVGADQNQTITLNFGDALDANTLNTGIDGLTCYTSQNNLQSINQDGYTSGNLSQLQIDTAGNINGSFSNGQVRLLGQVVTANFVAPDQLQRVGDNLFVATFGSGQPAVGASSAAAINAGNLEQSTTNLANNFIDMMSFERGFQANTRTVQTLNQMLAELVNLGR